MDATQNPVVSERGWRLLLSLVLVAHCAGQSGPLPQLCPKLDVVQPSLEWTLGDSTCFQSLLNGQSPCL